VSNTTAPVAPFTLVTVPVPPPAGANVKLPAPFVVNTSPELPSAPTSSRSNNPKDTAPVRLLTLSTVFTSAPASMPNNLLASSVG